MRFSPLSALAMVSAVAFAAFIAAFTLLSSPASRSLATSRFLSSTPPAFGHRNQPCRHHRISRGDHIKYPTCDRILVIFREAPRTRDIVPGRRGGVALRRPPLGNRSQLCRHQSIAIGDHIKHKAFDTALFILRVGYPCAAAQR